VGITIAGDMPLTPLVAIERIRKRSASTPTTRVREEALDVSSAFRRMTCWFWLTSVCRLSDFRTAKFFIAEALWLGR
jgi:hypothetical protein